MQHKHTKKNYEVKKKIVNVERGIKSFKIEQRWIIAISLAFCLTFKVLPLVGHSIDFLGVQFNAGYFRVYVLNRRQPSCLIQFISVCASLKQRASLSFTVQGGKLFITVGAGGHSEGLLCLDESSALTQISVCLASTGPTLMAHLLKKCIAFANWSQAFQF